MILLKCEYLAGVRTDIGDCYAIVVRSPEGDDNVELQMKTKISLLESPKDHLSEFKELFNNALAILDNTLRQMKKSTSKLCPANPEKKDPESNSSQIADIATTSDMSENFIKDHMIKTHHYISKAKISFLPSGRSPPR